jgi:hypothetical protein
MPSSGMGRHVGLVRTDVSVERVASFFEVENRRVLTANAFPRSLTALQIEARHSSETSILTRTTLRHIPEDGIFHSHRYDNLKS